jgi:predicted outer membrane protein
MRTRPLFVAAVAAASLLAACGSDSSTSKPTDTTTAGATDTTAAAGGTDTTAAAPSGSVSNDPAVVAYCKQIQAYKDKANSFNDVFNADTPDPKATEAAFTTMQSMLEDLANGAPSDIKADVDTVNGATKQLIAIFAKYEWDVTKLAASATDAAQLQTLMSDSAVSAASANLDTWGQQQCGFAPGS